MVDNSNRKAVVFSALAAGVFMLLGCSGFGLNRAFAQDDTGLDSHSYYCGKRVVGYYPYYRDVLGTLQYHNLTNVIYFSLTPNADGSLYEGNIDSAELTALSADAHTNGVEVSICVGGWGLSGEFPAMSANPAARAKPRSRIIPMMSPPFRPRLAQMTASPKSHPRGVRPRRS